MRCLIEFICESRIVVCDWMEGFEMAFKSQMESTKVFAQRFSLSAYGFSVI